jgi:hypothetical protein
MNKRSHEESYVEERRISEHQLQRSEQMIMMLKGQLEEARRTEETLEDQKQCLEIKIASTEGRSIKEREYIDRSS